MRKATEYNLRETGGIDFLIWGVADTSSLGDNELVDHVFEMIF